MTSYAHEVFLSKVIINIQCETFQNIKAELCVYRPTGIHIYKT